MLCIHLLLKCLEDKHVIIVLCCLPTAYRCVNANTADYNDETDVCTCNSGWTGTSCDIDINECTVHSGICTGSNEECENIDGSHKCNCVAGFYRELQTIYQYTNLGCKGEIVLGCYVK